MISGLTIHHIGYLVKNIEKAAAQFESLGYSIINEKCYDDYRKVDIVFLAKDGYMIELVSPVSDDSVVAGLMKRYKNTPYHICYETSDIGKTSDMLRSQGFVPIDEPTPAPAINGRRVQFFQDRHTGMLELLEVSASSQ